MVYCEENILFGQLITQAALSDYTSWRVGGPAKCLYIPSSLDDLSSFLSSLSKNEPLLFLGAGTNVLIADAGFDGTVIVLHRTLDQIQEIKTGDDKKSQHLIRAESGVPSAKLSRFAAEKGLSGLAFLAGIPGTIGGALAMNAGAHGGETWQCVVQVETINRFGERFKRDAHAFHAGYRHVIHPFGQEWFTAGYFSLNEGDSNEIFKTMRELLEKRRQSQPLDMPNAGSVFRNPKGYFAAQLIEKCGLKDFQIGGAIVSKKHANFIVNNEQATADDIMQLIRYIQKIVKEKTGVELVSEVKMIGFEL